MKKLRNNWWRSGKSQTHQPMKTFDAESGTWQAFLWQTLVEIHEGDTRFGALPTLHRLSDEHVFLTAKTCMRGPLATQVLSDAVATHIEKRGGAEYRALGKFVRACSTIWKLVGDGSAAVYYAADDARLQELLGQLTFFYEWRHYVFSQQVGAGGLTQDGRNKNFLSRESWYDLNLTVQGFVELCEFYLPTAPQGCGIKNCRLSQDPCENYFGYMRTKGGSGQKPSQVEARAQASIRQQQQVLSRKSNCAPIGSAAKKRTQYAFDERSEGLMRRRQKVRHKDDAM
eukprot:SAG25_NODE_426_length_8161_cov_2.532250_2_plen_285_part_00